jgi:hypothetical protein
LNNYQHIDVFNISNSHIDTLCSAPSFSALHQIAFLDLIPLNYSFLLEEEGEIVAACPLIVEIQTINDVNYKIGSLFNLSLPGPLIFNNINNNRIKNIVRAVFQNLEEKARELNISKIQYDFSYLNSCTEMISIIYKVLHKYHYLDTSLLTQRLDISKCPSEIMKQVSKGHRAIINKSKLEVLFQNVDYLKITINDFKKKMNVYHMDDNKLKYFFKLYNFNRLEFCDIYLESEEIGSLVFLKNNQDISYFLSHKKNGIDDSIHHKGLWASIEKYHFEKYKYLDYGVVFYGKNMNYIPSAKQLGISHFKSGFGGEICQFIRFEKYFDIDLFQFEQNQKLSNYKNSYFSE